MKDYMTDNLLATPGESVLLVIDVQERLISTIAKADKVITNIAALVEIAQIQKIPSVVTEQEKLGPTVPHLRTLLEQNKSYKPIVKQSFSCCKDENFRKALEATDRKKILVTGIETHICVGQTSLELLSNGYGVYVVSDATSAHAKEDHQAAIDRLRRAGAIITTTETLIYELTATAQTPEFRQILAIVKKRRKTLSEHDQ